MMPSKASTVRQYLNELPHERRRVIEEVRKVLLKNLDPLFEEGIQYGMIGYYVPHRVYPAGYHCDPKQPLPFICLASQKNYMSVYLGCVYGSPERERWFRNAWARAGKKLDMGKACLRFRKLEDLALDILGEAVRRVPARKFIDFYETAVQANRRPAAAKRSRPPPGRRTAGNSNRGGKRCSSSRSGTR